MNKYFIIFLLIIVNCQTKYESPVIYISNSSGKSLTSINCNFPNHHISLSHINPGETRSQSFYISSEKEFFGQIKCFWNNNLNEKKIGDFIIEKKHLPSFGNKFEYPYIHIFIDQDNYEIITNDIVDYVNKTRIMDERLLKNHKQAILDKFYNPDKSLIGIENLNIAQ